MAAFNYGMIGGLIYSAVTEGWVTARQGIFRSEMFMKVAENIGYGGGMGVLLNMGVQSYRQLSGCLKPLEGNHRCTSFEYVDVTLLAFPCIFATAYLISRFCPSGLARNYVVLRRDQYLPV